MSRNRILACLNFIVIVACGDPTPPKTSTTEHDDLNDVQLQCRSDKMLDIGQVNAGLGPSCDRSTMPFALLTFDLGSISGFWQAEDEARAQVNLCVCKDVGCSEKDAAYSIEYARKVMVDDQGKKEREGVRTITDRTASHACIDSTLAVSLFKMGYHCGYVTGSRSSLLRHEMEAHYAKFVAGDELHVKQKADECIRTAP